MARMAKTLDLWGKTYVLPPKGMYAGQPIELAMLWIR